MKKLALVVPVFLAIVAACSDDDPVAGAGTSSSSSTSSASSSGSSSSSSSGAEAVSCDKALSDLLSPIDKVSTGAVTVLATEGAVKKVYIDASAGGLGASAQNPRIYVNLETLTRVDVTDKTAADSTAWDLAIERSVLFTNSGSAGKGQGGAAQSTKDLAGVAAADATAATFKTERFVDEECNPQTDPGFGAVQTTFDGWYDYLETVLTPKPITFIVRGGTGKLFKLKIVTFYSKPDGTEGTKDNGGSYIFQIAPL